MSTNAAFVRTLVVGEALIDVMHSPDGPPQEHVGGSPLNVAIGLARLGHPAQLATWIGDDEHGHAIQRHLAADDVPLTPGSVGADHTSTATATLDERHAATYDFDITWRVPPTLPSDDGHLHTGSIAAVLQPGATGVRDAVIAARERGTVSYDPNVRPTLMGEPGDLRSGIEELVGYADVVKASDEDIAWLYGDDEHGADDLALLEQVMRLWGRLGAALVVATRGGDGALAYAPYADTLLEVSGRVVEVADTVGAGDSFMSALLSALFDAGLLGGTDARARLAAADPEVLRAAMDRAAAAAAITVSRPGAQPPTRAELDAATG